MPRYLLDTNILLHYVRGSTLSQQIEAKYHLTTAATNPASVPLISIVSEGEIRKLALEFGWGRAKVEFLERFLEQLVIVPLDAQTGLVQAYARIDDYSQRNGRMMGKNDAWIAATAYVTATTLLTTDHDFDHLDPLFLTRIWIDPAT